MRGATPNPKDLVTSSTLARAADRSESYVRKLKHQGHITPVARTPSGIQLYEYESTLRIIVERRGRLGDGR